jgi:hypothetical protein
MDEIKKDSALMAYREDLEDRGFLDRIKVHLTYEKPVHRYEGTIILYSNKLLYSAKDIQTEKDHFLEISREDVQEIHIGFDDIYKIGEDRLMGAGFQPVRITFLNQGLEKTAYFIMEFDRVDRRIYKNTDWYDELVKWKKG